MCFIGLEFLVGEMFNQVLKFGVKFNSIIVSFWQRGNFVLKFVCNVFWEFGDVIFDYVLGQSICVLFFSFCYYNLYLDYIYGWLQSLGKNFVLWVLFVQVDVKDFQQVFKELVKMCILVDCILIFVWSFEEVGWYLEIYKVYEQKLVDFLMEKLEQDFVFWVIECLIIVKLVNKMDSQIFLIIFGFLEQFIVVLREDLVLCLGLGFQKVRVLGKNLRSWGKERVLNKYNLRF